MHGMPDHALESLLGRWWDSTGRALRAARCRYGLIALASFGFLAPQGHVGTTFGIMLLLLGGLVHWRRFFHDLVRNRLFVLWCMLTVYVLSRAYAAALEFPLTSRQQFESALELAGTGFGIVLVSWWIAGETKRALVLVSAALLGFCLEVLAGINTERFAGVLSGGQRYMVGTALPMAFAGGIAIIGVVAFLPRLVRFTSVHSRTARIMSYAAMTAGAGLLAFVQVVTQSRAVVGMLVVLVPVMVAWQFLSRPKRDQSGVSLAVSTLVILVLFAAAVTLVGPKLADRFQREYDEVAPYVASGRLEVMPASSLGWRIHLNVHGANLVAERPWAGWGPGTSATRDLGDRYEAADLVFLSHLHNTYLEVLVRLGSIGGVMYVLAVTFILNEAIRSRWIIGRMPGDVGMFLVAGGILTAGWSLIDFRLFELDFVVPLILLAALAHTFGAMDRPDKA